MIDAVSQIGVIGPSKATAVSAVTKSETAANVKAPPRDVVNLSTQALQEIVGDKKLHGYADDVVIPGLDGTPAQAKAFQNKLELYEEAAKRVSNTIIPSDIELDINTINSADASEEKKLQAYSNYKVYSAFQQKSNPGIVSSDVDFAFNWLTRDSSFIVDATANDGALTRFDEQETLAANRTGQPIDSTQSLTKRLSVISSFNSVQQGVAVINILFDKLSSGLVNPDLTKELADSRNLNVNRVPGFVTPVTYKSDPKSVISDTISSILSAVSQSQSGGSGSADGGPFARLVTSIATEFGKAATERVQSSSSGLLNLNITV